MKAREVGRFKNQMHPGDWLKAERAVLRLPFIESNALQPSVIAAPRSSLFEGLKQRRFRDLAGARVEAVLPLTRDLLNLALSSRQIPAVDRMEFGSLENGIISLHVQTRIPLFRSKTIHLRPLPPLPHSPLLLRIEVMGGLSRMERWLMGRFSTDALRTEGVTLLVDLERLLFKGTTHEPLAASVRHLEISAEHGRLILTLSFLHQEDLTLQTSPPS